MRTANWLFSTTHFLPTPLQSLSTRTASWHPNPSHKPIAMQRVSWEPRQQQQQQQQQQQGQQQQQVELLQPSGKSSSQRRASQQLPPPLPPPPAARRRLSTLELQPSLPRSRASQQPLAHQRKAASVRPSLERQQPPSKGCVLQGQQQQGQGQQQQQGQGQQQQGQGQQQQGLPGAAPLTGPSLENCPHSASCASGQGRATGTYARSTSNCTVHFNALFEKHLPTASGGSGALPSFDTCGPYFQDPPSGAEEEQREVEEQEKERTLPFHSTAMPDSNCDFSVRPSPFGLIQQQRPCAQPSQACPCSSEEEKEPPPWGCLPSSPFALMNQREAAVARVRRDGSRSEEDAGSGVHQDAGHSPMLPQRTTTDRSLVRGRGLGHAHTRAHARARTHERTAINM